MKKSIYALTFITAMLAGAIVAHAGWKHSEPVFIDRTTTTKFGIELTLGHAEASVNGATVANNSVEYFYCTLDDADSGSCYFRDAEGEVGSCETSNANFVAEIRTVGAASFVEVEWEEYTFGGRTYRDCTYVDVQNGSAFAP